jgi:hypothetical protein
MLTPAILEILKAAGDELVSVNLRKCRKKVRK